jgi:cellobiose phosphorylase
MPLFSSDSTFKLDNPQFTSYLYFPLVNEAGMMSAITPLLHGDIKTGQNSFLMMPVSLEDLHNTRSARNFWVYVADDGAWSAAGNSAWQIIDQKLDQVTLEAGFLWHKIIRDCAQVGLRAEITNFVPVGGDQVELMRVALTNLTELPLTLTPTAAIPIYGRSADNQRDHRNVTSMLHRIRTEKHGVIARPTLSFDERGHTVNTVSYAVLGVEADGTAPVEFFPILEEFIGEGRNLDWPEVVTQRECHGYPAGQDFSGYEAIGGLRFRDVTLEPGQTQTYILILAIMPGQADTESLIKHYGSAALFKTELNRCQEYWQAKIESVGFHTADPTFEHWMKWVTLQPVLRRLFGNSFLPAHDYGRGGRGWRDLWQDCLALLLMEPDDVPHLLLSSYAGVRIDGSNATIIGAKPGEFVADRNNIPRVWMDHGAWPFLTTKLYIDQSGDLAFLLREQTYFKDPQINRSQARDDHWTPEQGTQLRTTAGELVQGTILEHILVQHLTTFFHVGEHNIIRLEGADWNDGMDMARQRGESVAFTALYASNLRELSKQVRALESIGITGVHLAAELLTLLDTLNSPVEYDDVPAKLKRLAEYFATCQHTLSGEKATVSIHDLANDLEVKANWLYTHLRRQEWITDGAGYAWFNGYYNENGQRVEGDHPNGVRMTLTGQVFTLMSGIADDTQTREIVRAADHYLYEPAMGGYRLNTDFGDIQLNLGRCFGYAFGHKENGAMFSHMAVMYANALYQRDLVQEGYKVLDGIYRHCTDFATSRIYPGIPEYINPKGRGMYTYLTGSASWFLLTLVTEVFGVKGVLGDLVLEPKLVRDQFDSSGAAQLTTLFAGRKLEVVYHNPSGQDYGAYNIQSVSIDGTAVPFDRVENGILMARRVLSELDEHQQHRIDVFLA